MGAVGDSQVEADLDASGEEPLHLAGENLQVQGNAGGDDVDDLGAEDAAGDQVKGEGFLADPDGVARVGAAGVSDNDFEMLGEQVDDLALALVAPL